MSAHFHATEETLMRLGAGTLAAGPSMVVRAHLAGCTACRTKVTQYEAVGGALLELEEPAPLPSDMLAALRARIEREGEQAASFPEPPPPQVDGIRLPDSLRGCEVGPWRWVGPGRRMSRLTSAQAPDANLILLKVGPGLALPDHGHIGKEFTYIVSGSYTDRFGTFKAGDLAEMDDDVEHQPIVDPESECICLAALEGKMRFTGLIGRILQPFVRI